MNKEKLENMTLLGLVVVFVGLVSITFLDFFNLSAGIRFYVILIGVSMSGVGLLVSLITACLLLKFKK